MAFTHSDAIEVKRVKGKGRGVFARRLIRRGEVIERVPVLVLPAEEVEDCEGWTGWRATASTGARARLALALGYGSLYNHSYRPNARYDDAGGRPRCSRRFGTSQRARRSRSITTASRKMRRRSVQGRDGQGITQQPKRPDAQHRCNEKTHNGDPHRNLSLVDPDLPAEGKTESMGQGNQSEDDP